MTAKLDQITNREWEQHRNSMSQPPTLPVFITFLNSRADLLETLEESKVAKTQNSQAFNNTKPKSFVINTNNNFTNHKSFNHKSSLCQLCNQSHFLFSCPNFRDLPVESRIKKAQDLKVCLNCLRPGHVLSKCKLGSCKYCRLKHNTLLHIENEPEQSTSQNVALTLNNTSETRTVLLSTALVNVVDTNGKLHTARVLLDNGSTANFVSEDFCHMTKEAFLAALNRFIARRGKPRHIFSDSGSTFVGAFNELAQLLAQDLDLNRIDPGITFSFIPAYTPHFGGLWESAVKSTKYHLKRILSLTYLTFEEMATCLIQIESILNSRPLTPISSDPSDLTPLTPAHFLIGRSLLTLPHPQVTRASVSSLQRFQRIEYLKQHFWNRFSNEYVLWLQEKSKWHRSTRGELKEGALVVIKDKTSPPLMWLMGRVIRVLPGSDGVARVADIRTRKGVLRRAFNTICPLPLQ
ncbi:uncharacterized protein LOC126975614 isoform X3 [Leptidea sinapis]|uniref:uncharacterized protein LOC126975614 isoform X3 n=1 Tax=Leptidea sinapis TaxID=189913 RepID=UPI0021C30491|nr:uncharacterized protein LOC126975614 isoform X3 [Leptidea sinapis]